MPSSLCRQRIGGPLEDLRIAQSPRLIKRFFRILALVPSQLCLDAPLVALGWSLAFRTDPEWGDLLEPRSVALFFAVWVIYLSDRIVDGSRKTGSGWSPPRHRFASDRRGLLLCLLGLALAGSTWAALRLDRDSWIFGAGLAAGVGGYFLLFRFRSTSGERPWLRFPTKEFAIAAGFTLGVLLGAGYPASAAGGHPSILLVIGFFLLVLVNCLVIAEAEREFDHRADPASFFVRTRPGSEQDPRSGVREKPARFLGVLPVIALVLGSIAWAFHGYSIGAASVVASAALLLGVIRCRIPLEWIQPTADFVLLVPWLGFLLETSGSVR